MEAAVKLDIPEQVRFESLDPLRGFSCLMIIVFHAVVASIRLEQSNPKSLPLSDLLLCLDYLSFGVPFFFVISGFCISASWWRIAEKRRPFEFLYRRFIRIFPPFWICWVLTGLTLLVLNSVGVLSSADGPEHVAITPLDLTPVQLLGNFTLTETWRPLVFAQSPAQMNVLGQMWTLCYEEQFYLLCFLLLFIDRRLFFPVMTLVAILVFVSTTQIRTERIPFLNNILDVFSNKRFLLPGTFLDSFFLDFYFGVAVFFSVRSKLWLARFLPILFIVTVLVCFGFEYRLGTRDSLLVHIAAGLFSLLLLIIHPIDHGIARSKILAPLHWCGIRCYSLYLTHGLLVTLISSFFLWHGFTSPAFILLILAPLSTVVSLYVGDLFYQRIEKRFLPSSSGNGSRITPGSVSVIATK